MEHVTYIDLPHPLTDEELDERRDQLASIAVEIDSEEKEAAGLRKLAGDAGRRVKELRGRSSAVAVEIRDRAATRRTKCVKHYDEEALETIIVREDTGDVVKIRAMEPHEQQIVLGDRQQGLSKAIRKAIADYRQRRARIQSVPDDPELEEEEVEPAAPEQVELDETGDTTEPEEEPEDPPTKPEPVGDAESEPEPEAEAAPEEAPADLGDAEAPPAPAEDESGYPYTVGAAEDWLQGAACSISDCHDQVLYTVTYPAGGSDTEERASRHYCGRHGATFASRHDLKLPESPAFASSTSSGDDKQDEGPEGEPPAEPPAVSRPCPRIEVADRAYAKALCSVGSCAEDVRFQIFYEQKARHTAAGKSEVMRTYCQRHGEKWAGKQGLEVPPIEEAPEAPAEPEDQGDGIPTDEELEADPESDGGLILFDDDDDLETPGGEIPEDEDLAGAPTDEELDELAEQMRPTGSRAVPDPEDEDLEEPEAS